VLPRVIAVLQDTQWNDIDYMKDHLDWTYDKDNFTDLKNVVKDLHDHGQHYIMIVVRSPCLHNERSPLLHITQSLPQRYILCILVYRLVYSHVICRTP
jgi:alpha-glucosidase (family GH31 glycosyl hydrolase)